MSNPIINATMPTSILKTRMGTGFQADCARSEAAIPRSSGKKIKARAIQLFFGILPMIPKDWKIVWDYAPPRLVTGRRMVNTVPRGSAWLLRTLIWPLCRAMMRLTSAKPRPLPSVLRAFVPRYSSSKIFG